MSKTTKNLLLSLKNCSTVKLNEFYCVYSNRNIDLLMNLYSYGFIQSFIFLRKSNMIKVILRYVNNKPIFKDLKFLSTGSKLKNVTSKELAYLFNKRFVLFLSTDLGVLSIYDCKKYSVGGKILFFC